MAGISNKRLRKTKQSVPLFDISANLISPLGEERGLTMSDYKTPYSWAAQHYVQLAKSEVDGRITFEYQKSLRRKESHGSNWAKVSVNINDIVDKFAPNAAVIDAGVKYLFKGEQYTVVADLVSGYLRIFDNALKKYVDLNGQYQKDPDLTHFRILKREEM